MLKYTIQIGECVDRVFIIEQEFFYEKFPFVVEKFTEVFGHDGFTKLPEQDFINIFATTSQRTKTMVMRGTRKRIRFLVHA